MGKLQHGLACLLWLAVPIRAFYIPGLSIKSYYDTEEIPLLVNKIWSDHSHLQYAYYDLPFVCPAMGHRTGSGLLTGQHIPLNLGEVLRGDRIAISDLDLSMGVNTNCTLLCNKQVARDDLLRAKELISRGYVVEWILDNLPGATSFVTVDRKRKYYSAGFKLGSIEKGPGGALRYQLNNHHTIVVRVRRAPGSAGDRGAKVVVGFEVYPKSVAAGVRRDANGCPADLTHINRGYELGQVLETMPDATDLVTIPYTYSVYFREDDAVEYGSRWHRYYDNQEATSCVHWVAVVNSVVVSGLLTVVVTTLLTRSVRADIKSYKESLLENSLGSVNARLRIPSDTVKISEKSSPLSPRTPQDAVFESSGPSPAISTTGTTSPTSEPEYFDDVPLTSLTALRADIFNPPPSGHLLAPLVGSGMQLLFMVAGLVILGTLGLFGPSFRGGIISVGIGLFVFAGLFSGYFSARAFATFEAGTDFRHNALVTATFFPGLLFAAVFVLNLFVWAQASSTAIPFGTLVALVVLWLGVQMPLVYAGSWYGFTKAGPWTNHDPVKARRTVSSSSTSLNEISRKASPAPIQHHRSSPRQPWYLTPLRILLMSGLVPFSIILLEVLSLFHSLYHDPTSSSRLHDHPSHLFSFASPGSSLASSILPPLTLLLLLTTVSETAIVSVHLHLWNSSSSTPSTQWWWRAFFAGASPAAWIVAYATWYYRANLSLLGVTSTILYFGNVLIASSVFGLLTGTVGFLSAFAFVKRVYGAIKAD